MKGRSDPAKPQKRLMYWLFAIYCFGMLYLLFFSRSVQFDLYGLTYREYLKAHINVIPFHTVRLMVQGAATRLERFGDTWLLRFAVKNLGGNLLLFVPLGLFLPCIWKGMRSYAKFALTVICAIAVVETLQLITTLGSMDIDDLIFNVTGASLGYGIWRLSPMQRTMERHGLLL